MIGLFSNDSIETYWLISYHFEIQAVDKREYKSRRVTLYLVIIILN